MGLMMCSRRPRAVRNVSPAASGTSASRPRGCRLQSTVIHFEDGLQSVSVFNTDQQDQSQINEFATVRVGPAMMSTMSSCSLIRA